MRRTHQLSRGAFVLALSLAACKDNPASADRRLTLSVSRDTATIFLDEAIDLAATIRGDDGAVLPGNVTWTSGSPGVASVAASEGASTARITGASLGTAVVMVAAAGEPGAPKATVTIKVVPHFTEVAVSVLHACGVSGKGVLNCWGANYSGELGQATSVPHCELIAGPCVAVPTPVASSLRFTSPAVGDMFSCALVGGAAYCWGTNSRAELGVSGIAQSATPVAVSGGHSFSTLVAGRWHVCGLDTAGDTWCWGSDNAGQLGAGAESPEQCGFAGPCSTTPLRVVGGHKFVALAANYNATCGLLANGDAYCWGVGVGGSDGLGCGQTTDCSHTPVLVGSGAKFTSIVVGEGHKCGRHPDGTLSCWGNNSAGVFGNGQTTGVRDFQPTPVPAAGGASFASVVSGRAHVCGIASDGKAWCWGSNTRGQAGTGTTSAAQLTPALVQDALPYSRLVSGGIAESTCGFTLAGRLQCWGDGRAGQLGNGATTSQSRAVDVLRPPS